MGRPRSVRIDYARLRYLQLQGYGKRRVAKELGCSVGTAGRLLRGLRPEGPSDLAPRLPARTSAGSGGADSESRSTTRAQKSVAAPPRRRANVEPRPPAPLTDWAWKQARDHLSAFKGDLPNVEFDEAVARLAARFRRSPASRDDLHALSEIREMQRDQATRRDWVRSARTDLERRWSDEVAFLKFRWETLEFPRNFEAAQDARDQAERLREILPRRLAGVRTKHSYFKVVDALLEEGLNRHRATLKRLRTEADEAKRREREADGK